MAEVHLYYSIPFVISNTVGESKPHWMPPTTAGIFRKGGGAPTPRGWRARRRSSWLFMGRGFNFTDDLASR